MYKEIAAHPRVREIYAQKLVAEGKLRSDEFEQMKSALRERLERARGMAKENRPRENFRAFGGVWKGISRAGHDWSARTAVPVETLKKIGEGLSVLPQDFTPFPKLQRILGDRADAFRGKRPLDWGAAESLALGSLLVEGTPIRFVGQDVQ